MIGRLLSVALSVGLPRLVVNQHHALQCSDFPLAVFTASGHSAHFHARGALNKEVHKFKVFSALNSGGSIGCSTQNPYKDQSLGMN